MPNEDIMGIPTKACINGLTKEDTDRLKNALIKKIEDDETTVDITEDGKIILANENNLFLSFDGNILGITKDSSGDYIPWTVPYLPEDENENPLAPPNDTIMTSANIGVDPRIVHTTGNENIAGNKNFNNFVFSDYCFYGRNCIDTSGSSTGYHKVWSIKVERSNTGGNFGLTLLGSGMRVGLSGHNTLSISQVSLRNGVINWDFLIRGENVNLSQYYVVKKVYTENEVEYVECEGYVVKANNTQKFFVALAETSNTEFINSSSSTHYILYKNIVSELPVSTETMTVITTNATSMNGIL